MSEATTIVVSTTVSAISSITRTGWPFRYMGRTPLFPLYHLRSIAVRLKTSRMELGIYEITAAWRYVEW